MRKTLALAMLLTLAIVFATTPTKANAPSTQRITPAKGKVGQTAVIHGTDLRGTSVVVMFGTSPAQNIEVLNNKTVKVAVPSRNVLDPNPVKVTVNVDGVHAAGDLEFYYNPPGPAPVITEFNPPTIEWGMPISVTIHGTDFTTPQGRVPTQIFLFGPETIEGIITSATTTSFTAEFLSLAERGTYLIIVGFSDGSGASAEGFQIV